MSGAIIAQYLGYVIAGFFALVALSAARKALK